MRTSARRRWSPAPRSARAAWCPGASCAPRASTRARYGAASRTRSCRSLHRGVYALAHRHLDRSALQRAGELAVGFPGAVSHADAASAWAFARSPAGPVELTLPGRSGRGQRWGITLHRPPLPPGDWVVRDGMRVTTPPRTLIDLAARSAPRELERVLDEAHFRGLVSASKLGRGAGAQPRACRALRCCAGAPRDHELGWTRTETDLEERVLALPQGRRPASLPVPGPDRPLPRRLPLRGRARGGGGRRAGRTWARHAPGRRCAARCRSRAPRLRGGAHHRGRGYGEPGPALGRVAAALSARRPSPAGSPACPSP